MQTELLSIHEQMRAGTLQPTAAYLRHTKVFCKCQACQACIVHTCKTSTLSMFLMFLVVVFSFDVFAFTYSLDSSCLGIRCHSGIVLSLWGRVQFSPTASNTKQQVGQSPQGAKYQTQGASNKINAVPLLLANRPMYFLGFPIIFTTPKKLPETSHAKGTADASFSMLRRSPTAVYLLLLPFREDQGITKRGLKVEGRIYEFQKRMQIFLQIEKNRKISHFHSFPILFKSSLCKKTFSVESPRKNPSIHSKQKIHLLPHCWPS